MITQIVQYRNLFISHFFSRTEEMNLSRNKNKDYWKSKKRTKLKQTLVSSNIPNPYYVPVHLAAQKTFLHANKLSIRCKKRIYG